MNTSNPSHAPPVTTLDHSAGSQENNVLQKPTASLSLDLDNLWTYLKVHGDARWVEFPTYLPKFVPIVLDMLKRRNLSITFFVVARDAIQEENREALRLIAESGHEIGNHSLSHEPWMQTYPPDKVAEEIIGAEERIFEVTGKRTIGFRGPGYCRSREILNLLQSRGYEYDTSILPSILGPIARLYYFWGTRLSSKHREERSELFGHVSEGFLPLKPFEWKLEKGRILEIPVSTMPVFRVPFHLSYLIWLSRFSKTLAKTYMEFALAMCRIRGVEPCYLLHPLDFLGQEDIDELGFFPGMDLPRAHKMEMAGNFLDAYTKHFDVVPIQEHARRIRARGSLEIMARAPLET